MTIVDDLLANGTVIPDPLSEEKVIFNVPIKIKKVAVNSNGFEIFATGLGWTPTVTIDGEEQPNPLSVHAYCIEATRNWVQSEFEGIIRRMAKEQAEAQASAQVAALI